MKKFLAMLLAICMILSSMVLAVSAEGEEHPEESAKIEYDAIKGDGNTGEYTENGGATVTREMGAGEYTVAQALYFAWFANDAAKDVEVPTFDITGMDYLEFEIYVSHPDYLVGVPVCFELTSGGTCDKEEDSFIKNADEWMLDKDGNYIKAGWNTVRVPLSLFPAAGADRTRINCFRMFNNGKVNVAEGETLVLTLKSFGFGTEADGITQPVPMDSEIGVGGGTWLNHKASNKTVLPAGKVTPGQWMAQYVTDDFGTQDLSNFRYVDITMKITNVEEFKKIKWEIELCSGGGCDKNENNYTGYFDDVAEGWNTIRVPLSAFTRKSGDGGANFSAINYMRMYSIGTEDRTLEKDVTIELTKFVFSDGAATNWKEYSFTAGRDTSSLPEGVTLVSKPTFGDNNDCAFADANNEIVYMLQLDKIEPSAMYITLTTGGNELLLQVGEKNNADTYKTVFDAEDNQPRGTYVINVADYVAMNKFASSGMALYLRVSDTDTSNGNGGQIRKETPVNFMVAYSDWETDPDKYYATAEDIAADEAEMMVTEHSVPLFGCNAALAGYEVDYNDKKAGSSSIKYTLGEWTEVDENGEEKTIKNVGTVLNFTTDVYAGIDAVDCTGMDTLEFWFYVSDKDALAAAAFADTGIELTSSGTCDDEETNWRVIENILPQCTENDWNEIRLPFSAGGKTGETDWTRVNFFRLFFVNSSSLPETPLVIGLDNIRLTDYEAQQIALETPAAEAMDAKIREKLGNIPEWDEDNADIIAQYDANAATWKADYDAIAAELDAMSDIAQGIVSDLGSKKIVTSVKRWLDRHAKYEPEPEPTPEPDPTPDPDPDPDPDPNPDPDPDPDPETPDEGGNANVIIIIVVAVVVVAAAVVAFIIIKKKKA